MQFPATVYNLNPTGNVPFSFPLTAISGHFVTFNSDKLVPKKLKELSLSFPNIYFPEFFEVVAVVCVFPHFAAFISTHLTH